VLSFTPSLTALAITGPVREPHDFPSSQQLPHVRRSPPALHSPVVSLNRFLVLESNGLLFVLIRCHKRIMRLSAPACRVSGRPAVPLDNSHPPLITIAHGHPDRLGTTLQSYGDRSEQLVCRYEHVLGASSCQTASYRSTQLLLLQSCFLFSAISASSAISLPLSVGSCINS
jgi:hypothetical protein